MLTHAQEKLVRSLHRKKGRQESGRCLLEGPHAIELAGAFVDFTFTRDDTFQFDDLVTTQTPQDIAAVARIPEWTLENIKAAPAIVVLDGVQDPGNVGTILRLCLGFNASLLLVESCDVTNPKVVRSSVGALFKTPWMVVSREHAAELILDLQRPVFRLEKTKNAQGIGSLPEAFVLIVGSEGAGISLYVEAPSLAITHDPALESLNVASALTIALHHRFSLQSSGTQN